MYLGAVNPAVEVIAVNCVTDLISSTMKSPSFTSEAFNIVNLLPFANPWALVVVIVVISVDATWVGVPDTSTTAPNPITVWPFKISSSAVLWTWIFTVESIGTTWLLGSKGISLILK